MNIKKLRDRIIRAISHKSNLCALVILLLLSSSIFADKFSSNAEYSLCFTPHEDCAKNIVKIIDKAKYQVLVQAYSFTDINITNALIKAFSRRIQVKVILDKSQHSGKVLSLLLAYGIPCFIDDSVKIAHNKIIIIDRETVIGGSYNYTNSAAKKNAENVTIITDSKMASKFCDNWERRKAQSRAL